MPFNPHARSAGLVSADPASALRGATTPTTDFTFGSRPARSALPARANRFRRQPKTGGERRLKPRKRRFALAAAVRVSYGSQTPLLWRRINVPRRGCALERRTRDAFPKGYRGRGRVFSRPTAPAERRGTQKREGRALDLARLRRI